MWTTTEIPTLDLAGFSALVEGRLPAVRIPDFASLDECSALSRQLLTDSLRTHTIPAVVRLGISQYQQGICDSKDGYFAQAAELRSGFSRMFADSFDPLTRFTEHLRSTGVDTGIMHEPDGRAYWAGSGKLRTGDSPLHVDFAPQDSPGWAVEEATAQLAWNLYLETSDGGYLQVWDRRWERGLDVHQSDKTYAFDPSVVDDATALEVIPVVGDIVVVNSRYFHAVTRTSHRLSFGSFISVFADGSARLWS